ncbi:MAG: hypothetical protein J5658_13870 [Prevotella sp.]|nr:hypothetical protein [Prevotella sp.]
MKKYLITGALALVACATLTSCHSDDELSGSLVEQKLKAYEQVFEEEFGKVDPNQDWGFGTAEILARTRTAMSRTRADGEFANYVGAYPDANMWTSKGFLAPDPLTHAQKLRAQYYFQKNHIVEPNRPDYGAIDFFMQQVYDGGTDPMEGKSPEKYLAADNSTYIESGEHMDHLTCGPDHTHTYNFNNGNCSTNYNVADRDQTDVNNTNQQHADEIQLLLNTKTSCFGYANSDASCVRDDRWTLVSAVTIDNFCNSDPDFATWLSSKLNDGEVDKECDDEFHRSFIGFDFDQLPNEKIFTGTEKWEYGNPDYDYQPHYLGKTYSENDYYRHDLYGNKYHYLKAEQNQYCGEFRTIDPAPNVDDAKDLLDAGWLPVTGSDNKKWVKVGNCNDGYFSDWIVTFMPADAGRLPETITIPIEPGSEGSDYKREVYYKKVSFDEEGSGRVFCEDLGVVRASDIDFNDIVFDVLIYKTEMITEYQISSDGEEWVVDPNRPRVTTSTTYDGDVWLLAGGGTIPATIQAGGYTYNVKQSFQYQLSDKVIVNTIEDRDGSYGNDYRNYATAKKLNDTPLAITSVADVKIFVTYGAEFAELTAYKGVAPHKICVPLTTKWLKEREEISNGYPSFTRYVKYQDKDGNYLENYKINPGVTENDGPEGGYVGDGDEYDFDEHANSVWDNPVTASLFTPDVSYTARHEAPNWTEAMVYMGMSAVTGGGTDSGYRNTDPVLVRRRH